VRSPRLQARVPLSTRRLKPSAHSTRRLRTAPVHSKTLLWIDDYQPGLTAYKHIFEAHGYRVLTASSGSLGLRLLQSHRADAVVVDYEMPDMDGGEVASEIRRRQGDLPIVMLSASTSVPYHVRQLVDAFCDKADSPTLLIAAIEGALSQPVSQ
jgi:CheY-like chemotaxis protein